jgi:uridine phosphorylase
VGDQNRVEKSHNSLTALNFPLKKNSKPNGMFKGKRISVMSTGIGPDNIDIVINELDALVNIDLETRKPKKKADFTKYYPNWNLRLLQADIPVDSFVMSKFGLGLDNMLRSYLIDEVSNLEMEDAFVKHTNWDVRKALCNCLFRKTRKNNRKRQNAQRNHCYCRWFYGPQGRISLKYSR